MAAAATTVTHWLVLRTLPVGEDRDHLQRELRQRRVGTVPELVVTGFAMGIAAAGLRSTWVAALFTAATLLGILLPLARLPALRRRITQQ